MYVPKEKPTLKTLQQAILHFANPQNCIDYVVRERWPDGIIICPNCGCTDITYLPTRQLFQCRGKHPKRQFSVKVGTVFAESPLPLSKWLLIMWMLTSCRNGISSYEVARTIGITQKSAWFMLHRLRVAMQSPSAPLDGDVEADETYVGAKLKNKHRSKLKQGTHKDKTPVFGMVERGGRVIAHVTVDAREKTIQPLIEASVSRNATLYTDSYTTYDKLRSQGFKHYQINHVRDQYVVGSIHTNTIENFWSCLKRTLKGTYIAVRPKHLMRYVQESTFRFNVRRGFTEDQRFSAALMGIAGKRLTYRDLVGGVAA